MLLKPELYCGMIQLLVMFKTRTLNGERVMCSVQYGVEQPQERNQVFPIFKEKQKEKRKMSQTMADELMGHLYVFLWVSLL